MYTSSYERMPVEVYPNADEASADVAEEIAALIRGRQKEGKNAVLGLATGSTPTKVYGELVRMHKEEGLSFGNVITFNLDEYYPIQPGALQSYVRFMDEQLFDHIDIPKEQVHIPDGTLDPAEVPEYCERYEELIEEAGGIDIQLLGIGRTGHVGFNEPGSAERSKTRLVTLDNITREDAAGDFLGKENVPRKAITMGIKTIMNARRVILMAWGEHKAEVIARAVEGEITDQVPATYLQEHEDLQVILDEASATQLTRNRTPWLVRTCEWDDALIKKAVVWLSRRQGKPILKLVDKDYNENGLSDLITNIGTAYEINIKIFNQIQHSITGWPGGKPEADDTNRPERAKPFPKRVLVFSPHPDDDAFSMGGTIMRLVNQGHEVHTAYQTSGSIGVHDEQALRFADFVIDYHEAFGLETGKVKELFGQVHKYLEKKSPGDADSEELRMIKSLIRVGEAKTANRYMGVPLDQVYFLNMPFYETGRIRKKPLGETDISLMVDVLRRVKPHQVYAVGELSDPHGTHRLCMDALEAAWGRVKEEKWTKDCYIWLYRGAWQGWDVHEIDMAVPLSPDELNRKRNAVAKHESQKDHPLYPGDDSREFWDRIYDRMRTTAGDYDALGLAEYEAIEGFTRWRMGNRK